MTGLKIEKCPNVYTVITGILAALNNIEYANIYEWTHFGKPDNKTNFMTCHVSGPKPKDWIQIWHDIFD